MMTAWVSEYRPPGNSVAYSSSFSSLNDTGDSAGKNTQCDGGTQLDILISVRASAGAAVRDSTAMLIAITNRESAGMTLLLVSCRVRRCPPAAQAMTCISSALPMPGRLAPPVTA